MKLGPTQFGSRENTASPRQHASRLSVGSHPNAICVEEESPETQQSSPESGRPELGFENPPHAASLHVATEKEEGRRVERNLDHGGRMEATRKPPVFETLLRSEDAARLLGNIHVKTLQRYARHGSVPGYRIGGHWYFRISELDAWLQSRINSNRQSVR
jgi:excisionase family DNA binding protein